MNPAQFEALARALPEPHLLVTTSGEVVAANRPALGLFGGRTVPFALRDAVLDAQALTRYLAMCERSGSMLPGALALPAAAAGGEPRRFRCEAAGLRSEGSADAFVVLRIRPQEAASRRFLLLNRKVDELNREIQERRRAEDALYGQTLELEELAAEQEQTLEELQARTEEALSSREAAQRAAARLEILAEAATVLSAALDYEAALRDLASFATATVADYCVTYLVDDGGIRRVGVAHENPDHEPLVLQLQRLYPPDPQSPYGAAHVIRTGEPVIATDIPDELLERSAQDAEHLRILRALQPRSSIIVPLQARGRTLGAIAIATTAGGKPRYTREDLTLVQEIARRAALAIDNARLFQEAQDANIAKSNFLATMSHELRTPLNAIVGYTDLLDTGIGGELQPSQKRHLDRIRASARHLATIIEEVLTFTRIEAGKERVRAEPADARQLLVEAAELVAPVAANRGLTLEVERGGPVAMTTDPGKVRQILVNLLGNAIKFTDEGVVTLSLEEQSDAVVFRVRDTGIGISPEHIERIFEPFWQIEQHTTRRAGGTGLGLTVTRRLARVLGGDIAVESSHGQGSTFSVRVPRTTPAGTASRDAVTAPPS